MAVVKRSVMTLFSDPRSIYDHCVRIVLAEKAVTADVYYVDDPKTHEDLLELNPEGILPTLIDRDLMLMYGRIILEYLDERFPHPPLLPVYPVLRAKARLMMAQIEKDWYQPLLAIERGESVQENRKILLEYLLKVVPLFEREPFFMGEDFTVVDCCIAALLWRLPALGIELPQQAHPIVAYADRIFDRNSFQASLSPYEVSLRESDDF
ncbi:MAG: stringent starvation protein A [Legionellales bacterium]|nr:stringent starvation protein A [Legionellales bacterium]